MKQNANPFTDYRWLPMFYMIPPQMLKKCHMDRAPRNPYEFIKSPEWRDKYHSESFGWILMRSWAFLVWPFLGVRGKLDHYSWGDPLYGFAHLYPMWGVYLRELGVTTQMLADFPRDESMPYFPEETLERFVRKCVELCFAENPQLLEMRDTAMEHRDFRDFNPKRLSAVQTDHARKYYHTRSKRKEQPYHQTSRRDFLWSGLLLDETDDIDCRVDLQTFLAQQSEVDQRLVRLLATGYTQAEIAACLGFANHSVISKRLQRLKQGYHQIQRQEPPPRKEEPCHHTYTTFTIQYKRND